MRTMTDKRILIVDDEANTRAALARAVEPLGAEAIGAEDGETALRIAVEQPLDLVLLDLLLPGMDGMAVLRIFAERHPDLPVAIVTAHGTIADAVAAMKLGAIDFIQKPFSLEQIRDFVRTILERDLIADKAPRDYETRLELARREISRRNLTGAEDHVRAAIGLDPSRPDGFNLLGMMAEVRGDRLRAQKLYRAALDLEPTYSPARENLDRSAMSPGERLGPDLLQEGGGDS